MVCTTLFTKFECLPRLSIYVHAFLSSDVFHIKNKLFSKSSFMNITGVLSSVDPDQTLQNVGPDMGPNCFHLGYQQTIYVGNMHCPYLPNIGILINSSTDIRRRYEA